MVGNKDASDNVILVPLTNSLYVKGQLADREKVLVDVGTGFYVEKVWRSQFLWMEERSLTVGLMQTTDKAITFYTEKAKNLDSNLQDLEKIVHGKSTQLRAVEEGESANCCLYRSVRQLTTCRSFEAKDSQRRSGQGNSRINKTRSRM